MIEPPVAIGIHLCDRVIVEEGTGSVSLIGVFSTIRSVEFPMLFPARSLVYCALTNGDGDANIELVLTHLETNDEVHTADRRVFFSDRFEEVHVIFELDDWIIPSPGTYVFAILSDGEWVGQRRFQVILGDDDQ
jgi:hypothetical protein